MEENTQEVIFANSDKAAFKKTVTGWISRNGGFYGDNEILARWDGSTHKKCDCGEVFLRNSYCRKCSERKSLEKFNNLKEKEWDEETPLCIYNDDTFFFDYDGISCFAEDNNLKIEDLQLVICEPCIAKEIDFDDYYYDDLPQDMNLGEVNSSFKEKFDELNKYISDNKIILSWWQGSYRVAMKQLKEVESD